MFFSFFNINSEVFMKSKSLFSNIKDDYTRDLAEREFEEVRDLVDIFERGEYDVEAEEGIQEGFKMLSVNKDF